MAWLINELHPAWRSLLDHLATLQQYPERHDVLCPIYLQNLKTPYIPTLVMYAQGQGKPTSKGCGPRTAHINRRKKLTQKSSAKS